MPVGAVLAVGAGATAYAATKSAPKAPDPAKTAAAQGAMNKETAIAQANLNNVNQVTPQGNLTYTTTGTNPDGTPQFTATQTYSPEMQALYDKYSSLAGTLGTMGNNLATNNLSTYSTPYKSGNEATEARLFELGSKRLDPMFSQREDELRTRLVNQGLQPGTDAWNAEMASFGQGRNDAYNNLLLSGRSLADQEGLTERNQGMNEMQALLSGTQVQQPNYVSTPQTPVSGVDYAGLVNNQYNQANQNYQAQIGGLYGLGGTVAGGWARAGFPSPSDRRLKEDVKRIGVADNGLPIYSFRYIGSKVTTIGFLADEVREVHPEAVVRIGEFDFVRYDIAVL